MPQNAFDYYHINMFKLSISLFFSGYFFRTTTLGVLASDIKYMCCLNVLSCLKIRSNTNDCLSTELGKMSRLSKNDHAGEHW